MEKELTVDDIMEYIIKGGLTLEQLEEIEKYLRKIEEDSIKLSYLYAYGIDNTMAYEEEMHAYYCEEDDEDDDE